MSSRAPCASSRRRSGAADPSTLWKLEELFAAAPVVRELRISPIWQREGAIPKPRVELFSSRLAQLRTLKLNLGGGGDELARAVASSRWLGGLAHLKIAGSVFDRPTQARFDVPWMELILGDDGAGALAASPHLAGLRGLDLARNDIRATGVAAILAGTWSLEALELGWNQGADVTRAFVTSRRPPTLRTLGLAYHQVQVDELEPLLHAPALAGLERLDLDGVALGEAGGRALAALLPSVPALRSLKLRSSGVAGTDAEHVLVEAAAGRIELDLR
jgi:hypothetical protein